MSNTNNKRKRSKSPAPSPSVEERTDGSGNQGNPSNDKHLEPSAGDNCEEVSVKTSVEADGCNDRPQNAQTDDLPSVEELLRQSRANSNGRNGGTEADGTDGEGTNSTDESPQSNHSNSSGNSKQRKSQSNDRSGDGTIAKKASDTLASKTSQQAQELIKADKRSKQQRLETGIREGIEDAKDIRKGYQLGLLYGLTKSKERDSTELDEQLQKLRQHTDASMGDELQQALDKVLGNLDTEDAEDEEDSSDPLDLGKLFENNSDEETLNLFC